MRLDEGYCVIFLFLSFESIFGHELGLPVVSHFLVRSKLVPRHAQGRDKKHTTSLTKAVAYYGIHNPTTPGPTKNN